MESRIIKTEEYPYLLNEVKPRPKQLYCVGAIPPGADFKYLCVIGARRYSHYGKEVCHRLIKGLRNYPIVIVSGLAIGIDSIAHEAALDANLKIVAFPGSGLSSHALYPRSRRNLALRIAAAGGTLLSPFEPKQIAAKWTFPVRNELMAGTSHATIVIEGRHKSGTLITADNALRFGRDVLVVPGSILEELSFAPHYLFKQGAIPIFKSEDIIEALGFNVNRAGEKQEPVDIEELDITDEHKKIIRELQKSPLSASDLVIATDIPSSRFNILMSELELRDLIIERDGLYKVNGL